MGFFASRWIEKHGAASERAALGTIISGLGGPNTSGSEGAGSVKSKWVSPALTHILIQPGTHFSTSKLNVGPTTQPVAQLATRLASRGRLTLLVSTTPRLDSSVMLTRRLFQYSRKPKDVQIHSPQPNQNQDQNQAHGTQNGYGYTSQLQHQESLTSALGQGNYGTWSGPPPLSPAVSTSRSTLALETNNSASVYSYTVSSGPSREQILHRAAQRGPTDTVTSVPRSFFSPPPPFPSPPLSRPYKKLFARFERLEVADRYFSSLLWPPPGFGPGWRSLAGLAGTSLGGSHFA